MRRKIILALDGLAVLALACMLSGISFAQSTRQDRIVGPIAGSPAVWLEGNTRPMFRPENDLGPVADSFKLENITLAFKPTAEQQANLEALLDDQQNPSSPLYHHWLTPEQFADSFGLSASDVAQVVAWLQSQGFTVTYTARSRTWVFFSGTAAQVQAAFQTEIHSFSVDGQTYYANASEPAVPAVLADVVLGFRSLDNYGPKPRGVFRQVSGGDDGVDSGVAPGFSPALNNADISSSAGVAGVAPGFSPAPNNADISSSAGVAGVAPGFSPAPNNADISSSAGVAGVAPGFSPALNNSAISSSAGVAGVAPGFSPAPNNSAISSSAGVAPGFSPALNNADIISSAGLKPGATPGTEINPEFTSYLSSKNFLAPGDFAVIYDLTPLYSQGTNGTGQKIAVMGQTDLYGGGSDITAFRAAAQLPAYTNGQLDPILIPGATDPGVTSGDIQEASLDVEWSGAVAPNAQIIFVNGGSEGVFNAFQYAISEDLAPVITVSYGGCESSQGNTALNILSSQAMNANSMGITIMAAAGDEGAADCDYSSSTKIIYSATQGLAVDAPASVPYVTAMGGSEYNEGAGNYWATAPNNGDVITSALFYIPEMVWNDTSSTNGLEAGGGGASIHFSKPSWQMGGITPNDSARDVPDLSLNASPNHDGYLTCVQASCVSGFRNPNNPTLANALSVAGGTSAAAPSFAGIVALINQAHPNTPPGQGNINPILYAMATNAPAAIHDITVGNNMVPCSTGTPNCPVTAPFMIGFNAGPGYDQASGLGSVDAYNLVTAWNSAATGNLPAPTLTAPTLGALAVASPVTFTWSQVSGNNGYRIMVATSPAYLTTNPLTSTCSQCTIVQITPQNTNSFTYPNSLAANTLYYWEVQAIEPPIPGGGSAAWSNVFVFNPGTPDFSLSASPNTLSMAPGGTATSTVTINPISGFQPLNAPLTCSVAGTLAFVSCSIGTLGGNNQATVTITAGSLATSYPPRPRNPRFGGWWVAGLALLGFLLIGLLRLLLMALSRRGFFGTPAYSWSVRQVALAAALATLLAASLSCGGGSSGGGGGGTTTSSSESGNITVTGTPTTGNAHTATISVTVS